MTQALPAGERRLVPRALLRHDPRNPRGQIDKTNKAVIDMAASMRVHGQIEPMVARPTPEPGAPDALTIVCGHVRDVALGLASIEQADVIVRDMTAEQAFEVMVVENGHREALSALGEARAFDLIVQTSGSVQAAALRVSLPVSYVRTRLTLLALEADVQRRLADGKLPIEHALSIARLPRELHLEAMHAITHDDGSVMALRDATQILRDRFTLRLQTAPFDRSDPDLVEGVGPCTSCPKRSGAQGELFGDVATPDQCLDSACFESKREAGWAKRSGEHRERKLTVISNAREARALIEDPSYLDLESPCLHDPSERPWKAVLGPKVVKKLPTMLARDKDKGVHELVGVRGLADVVTDDKAKAAVQTEVKRRDELRQVQVDEEDRRNKRDAKIGLLLNEVVTHLEAGTTTREIGIALALCALDVAWPETVKDVAKRHETDNWRTESAEDLRALITGQPTAAAAIAIAFELILTCAGQKGEDPFGGGAPLALVQNALKAAKKAAAPAPAPKEKKAAKEPPKKADKPAKTPEKKKPTKKAKA